MSGERPTSAVGDAGAKCRHFIAPYTCWDERRAWREEHGEEWSDFCDHCRTRPPERPEDEMKAFVAGWFAHARNPERRLVEDGWHGYRARGSRQIAAEVIREFAQSGGDTPEFTAFLTEFPDHASRGNLKVILWRLAEHLTRVTPPEGSAI